MLVSAPSLALVAGDLTVLACDSMALNLAALVTVGGTLRFSDSVDGMVDASALVDVGTLIVRDNTGGYGRLGVETITGADLDLALHGLDSFELSLPNLATSLTAIYLQTGNNVVFSAPVVPSVDGLFITSQAGTGSFNLAGVQTVANILLIAENPNLTSAMFDLSSLVDAPSQVVIADNPALSMCAAQALVAQLNDTPTTLYVGGNLDDTPCL